VRMSALEEELRGMKLGALSKRARQAGVTPDALERAQDEDVPQAAVIALVLSHEAQQASARPAGTPPGAPPLGVHDAASQNWLRPCNPSDGKRQRVSDNVAKPTVQAAEELVCPFPCCGPSDRTVSGTAALEPAAVHEHPLDDEMAAILRAHGLAPGRLVGLPARLQ